ncbi:MAG: hypothetical protein PHV45_04585 [Desulfuromonas thiophila]|nr:hypothetical protein [Desulfuromonas thiophila]
MKKHKITLPDRAPNFLDVHFVRRPDLHPDDFPPHQTASELAQAAAGWDWVTAPAAEDPTKQMWLFMMAMRPFSAPDRITPHDLLECFCGFHENGIFPPPWVMNALYDLFDDYLTKRAEGRNVTLGSYFGEDRSSDWQRLMKPVMSTACSDVYCLITWFHRSRTRALDIVALRLELAQAAENLPPAWQGRQKLKLRGALEQEYDRLKPIIEDHENELRAVHPVTAADRDAVLLRLGEDALNGEPDLIDRLRQIKAESHR